MELINFRIVTARQQTFLFAPIAKKICMSRVNQTPSENKKIILKWPEREGFFGKYHSRKVEGITDFWDQFLLHPPIVTPTGNDSIMLSASLGNTEIPVEFFHNLMCLQ